MGQLEHFEKSWLWVINLALRTRTLGGRGVGSMRTSGGGGSKIGKILRTSFMDGPLNEYKIKETEIHWKIIAGAFKCVATRRL